MKDDIQDDIRVKVMEYLNNNFDAEDVHIRNLYNSQRGGRERPARPVSDGRARSAARDRSSAGRVPRSAQQR